MNLERIAATSATSAKFPLNITFFWLPNICSIGNFGNRFSTLVDYFHSSNGVFPKFARS